MAQQDAREQVVSKVKQRLEEHWTKVNADIPTSSSSENHADMPVSHQSAQPTNHDNAENMPAASESTQHHHIASSKKCIIKLSPWLFANDGDPAVMVCSFSILN